MKKSQLVNKQIRQAVIILLLDTEWTGEDFVIGSVNLKVAPPSRIPCGRYAMGFFFKLRDGEGWKKVSLKKMFSLCYYQGQILLTGFLNFNSTKLSASLAFSFLLRFHVYSSFLIAHLVTSFLSFINRKNNNWRHKTFTKQLSFTILTVIWTLSCRLLISLSGLRKRRRPVYFLFHSTLLLIESCG